MKGLIDAEPEIFFLVVAGTKAIVIMVETLFGLELLIYKKVKLRLIDYHDKFTISADCR